MARAKIGILAAQGAFAEHEKAFRGLGCECVELRQRSDIAQKSFDALALPGGESTVQGKLLRDLDMLLPLKSLIEDGLPVLATCAGLILLARRISNDKNVYIGTLPVTVRRNAYGRQLGSFRATEPFADVGSFPMTFIRAPSIEGVLTDEAEGEEVRVLCEHDGKVAGVQFKKQVALAFHPELEDDARVHEYFLRLL